MLYLKTRTYCVRDKLFSTFRTGESCLTQSHFHDLCDRFGHLRGVRQ